MQTSTFHLKKNPFLWVFALGLFASTLNPVVAAEGRPLKSATVVEKHNNVFLGKEVEKSKFEERPAVEKDVVAGNDFIRTDKKSRAELEFTDKSLARLGSNTIFSFDPTSRKMEVRKGSALIHIPPNLSGATISSPAATVAVLGDVVAMRVDEKGVTQVVALSQDERGPVTVTSIKTGEKRTLKQGEMITIDPMDVRLPDPLTIAVDVFVQSSTLLNAEGGFQSKLPESAVKEIHGTEVKQQAEIKSGELEGGAQVVAKADGNLSAQVTGSSAINVQSTATSRFGGIFLGRSVQGPSGPSPGALTGTFVTTVSDSGLLTGVGTDNGFGFTFTGQLNNDGTFTTTGSGGSASQGTYNQNSFQGTLTTPADPIVQDKLISGTRQ